MKSSNNIPIELNCENLGFKKFPIVGYPLNVYNGKFENPIYKRDIRRQFHSNPIIIKKYSNPPFFKVPRYRLNYAQKNVHVPVFHKIPKIVEIPEIREITKFVDVVKVVDVPVEQVRMIPKLKIREVEKIRHIPGPIEYIDIPQEHIIHKPYTEVMEKIYEIPEIEDIEIEVPIYVPTPVGPPEDIHIDIPLPYDVPQFCFKPDKNIPQRIPIPTLHNMNNIPNIYFQNERFSEHLPKVDISNKNQKNIYSSPPMECGTKKMKINDNNTYCKTEYDKNENNINKNFDNYGQQNRTKISNENTDYYKYNINYDSISNTRDTPKNENNVNSSDKNEKYYYSYSSYNKYNRNNIEKNIQYDKIDGYSNNYGDNKNYIYDDEFENKSSKNKNYIYDDEFENKGSNNNDFTAEIIVQKKKNFHN
ncbi:inner membrane complex protein 1l, putative [Plasmodium relictum]|uniref:Inner membrane complex protein 1l, putative n=1 Tax=Plasmodium relictum TaxID=85471 RepID=A0A1J1HDU3_PLARL|nr:inner membrane complex protein 1l, putative [Plasmodium relictum]CRH03967.1 inner membrane complex protein 1l, putative [Plasmodium relictum]